MSEDLYHQLDKLARRQRNRIWLKRIGRRMSLPIAWFATVLFVGGSVHLWLRPLDTLVISGMALLPTLLMLAWIIVTEKPTISEGAAAADSLFDAHALFVSAWELSRSQEAQGGIGRLLLERSKVALPDWHRHNQSRWEIDIKPTQLLAIMLSLVGLLFLLQPTHVETKSPSLEKPAPQNEVFSQSRDSSIELRKLFTASNTHVAHVRQLDFKSSIQTGSSEASTTQAMVERESTMSSTSEDRLQTAKRLPRNQDTPPSAPKVTQPNLSTNPGGKLAQRTPGNDSTSDNGSATAASKAFDHISFVYLDAGTDRQTPAFASAADDTGLIADAPEQAIPAQSAIHSSLRRSPGASATPLTAEQRTLVRRYFKQLEAINDNNE